MTFKIDLETWFKFIAKRLPKSSIYVKYEPDKSIKRGYMLSEKIFCVF